MKFKALALMLLSTLLVGCKHGHEGQYVSQLGKNLIILEIGTDDARIVVNGPVGWKDDTRVDVEGEYTVSADENTITLKSKSNDSQYQMTVTEDEKAKLVCVDCSGIKHPKTQLYVEQDQLKFMHLGEPIPVDEAIEETKAHDAKFAEALSTYAGAVQYEIDRCTYNGAGRALCKCFVKNTGETISAELHHKMIRAEELTDKEKLEKMNFDRNFDRIFGMCYSAR